NDAGRPFSWLNWANPTQFNQNGTWQYMSNVGCIPRLTTGNAFVSNFTPSADAVAYTLNDASYGLKVGNSPGTMATADFTFRAIGSAGSIVTQDLTGQRGQLNDNSD